MGDTIRRPVGKPPVFITVPLRMICLPPGKNPEDYGWKIVDGYATRTTPSVGNFSVYRLDNGWKIEEEEIRLFYPDDAPPPAAPSKPYNEAVNEVHRYLKEVVEKAPDTQIDRSVKEGVIDDIDKTIERRKEQKTWPGALR